MEEKGLVVSQPQDGGITIFASKDSFELGQRMARVFSESSLVPKQYQGNIGNCMIALNMAHRMKSDPLMVMQNLVLVHNVPTFEAKFAIACFNATGKYSAIKYKEVGERGKDSWGMVAYAIEKTTGDLCEGPAITIGMAKAEGWYNQNPKWKNIPDLMLRYRSASWFIRTTDPGVMMGFQTREEVEDYTDYEDVTDNIPIITPDDANSEELNITPASDADDSERESADSKREKPTKEKNADPATSKQDTKPMGKQEIPDIFGGAEKK